MKYQRTDRYICRKIADTVLLLPLGEEVFTNNTIITLNETAQIIYKLLEQPRSLSELSDALADEYDITREQAGEDTAVLLETLISQNVVSVTEND